MGYSRSNVREVLHKKLVNEISLNFPELLIIGKYVKIRFKNRGPPCYFLEVKRIKNITKTEQNRLFLFTFLVSFFIVFLAPKLIYTINIYLTLCLAHFLNKIIYQTYFLGVHAKRCPKCAHIPKQKLRTIP